MHKQTKLSNTHTTKANAHTKKKIKMEQTHNNEQKTQIHTKETNMHIHTRKHNYTNNEHKSKCAHKDAQKTITDT